MSDNEQFPKYSYVHGGVRVELDLKPYEAKMRKAQWWLGNAVLNDSKPYMPIQTGGLQQRSHVEDDGKKVIFPGPHGRYQYYGKVMVDSATGRGPFLIQISPGEWAPRFRRGAKLKATDRPLTYSNPQAQPEWFEHAKKINGQRWIDKIKEMLGGK